MCKHWFIYGLTSLCALSACSPVPENILSQKEMRAVLADMQIAEAIINADQDTYRDDAKKLALYESVFNKYHITQAEYDSSLTWYAQNLDIYMRVYNLVSKDIEDRIHDLGDVERTEVDTQKSDSVDIWSRRNYLTFSPKASFNGTTFNIEPKESYPPGSTFKLGMNVWGIPQQAKHKPQIRICLDQGDTTVVINDQIMRDGYHETTLKSVVTKRTKRVYGFIYLNNHDMDYYKIYTDSISLMRYNYKSIGFESAKDIKPKEN